MKTCKEKKKEAEEQAKKQEEQKQQVASNSNSNESSKKSSGKKNSNKVWCEWKRHYVDKENFIDMTNRCQGCEVRRSLSSTFTYEDCPVCGNTCAVSRYLGKCQYCGEKIYPAVKKIYDDGTVILEDGSTL